MAVVLMDSFDWMQSTYDSSRCGSHGGTASEVQTNTPFSAGRSLRHRGDTRYKLDKNYWDDTMIIGFHYQIATDRYRHAVDGRQPIIKLRFEDQATPVMELRCTKMATPYFIVNGTAVPGTTAGTSSIRMMPRTWYHFEIKWTIKDSIAANECQLYIDGTLAIDIPAASDTKPNPVNSTRTDFLWIDAGDAEYMDNLYVLDTTGSHANGIMGPDTRMEMIYPSGTGNYAQWVGSDADSTNNYLHVDELEADGDTSYVKSSTSGQRDSYTCTNLAGVEGAPVAIQAIQLLSNARKTAGEARELKHFVRISSTDYDSSGTHPLSQSTNGYVTNVDIENLNPNTSAQWTTGAIDALEIGVKLET